MVIMMILVREVVVMVIVTMIWTMSMMEFVKGALMSLTSQRRRIQVITMMSPMPMTGITDR